MVWKQWSANALIASLCASQALAQQPEVFSKASNESLLWGPYKSNLYFGVRPRIPKSLTTSLMWARVEDFTSVQNNVRHTCEQHEGMAGYGWDAYDPRTGGVQTIHDKGNGLDLETSFVTISDGAWAARVKGTPREDAEQMAGSQEGLDKMKTAVWFNLGLEGLGSLEVADAEEAEELGYEGDVVFNGQTNELGEFTVTITEPESNSHPAAIHPAGQSKPLDRTLVHSLQAPVEAIWQAKTLLFGSMKTTVDEYVNEYTTEKMPPPWQTYTIQNRPGQGNFHLVEKVFEGPFEFDILFKPKSREMSFSSAYVTKQIESIKKDFDKKYLQVLKPQSPFALSKYLDFSKSLFSNLIGGIGYFYGDQVVDRSYAPEYDEENEGFWQETAEARARNQHKLEGPYELFTAVPSRPFFPRGFLWDEGFHLLPILEWDPELTMQILSSWFNLMDDDGWIGREQILGNEARSKVPAEFQVQYPHYANPPTLFTAIEALLDKAESKESTLAKPDEIKAWLRSIYPLLQRHFDWYRRTQYGDLKSYDRPAFSSKEAYRWRGRTEQHILTSGLDDYPRAQPPHPGELHVDLMSWMGLFSRNMGRISAFLGESEDEAKYSKIAEAIRRNVDDLHWDAEAKTYCDATVDDYEESIHVCHKGYISIFPFMTGLLGPNHKHIGDILDLIGDKEELWSPHGIRSLSKQDEFYGTAENYWRSPVWMPLNYLIVKNLLVSDPVMNQRSRVYLQDRTGHCPTIRPAPEARNHHVQRAAPQLGRHCVRLMARDGLRLRAVQPGHRGWPAYPALHWLDQHDCQDHELP